MIIKIPFKTPSVNHLYGHFHSRKFLKAEAKRLREIISDICEDLNASSLNEELLKVKTVIYEDWYCKNGSVRRADIANREKFLVDSVFNALGIDDRFIFEHTMIKEVSDDEYAIIEIRRLEDNGEEQETNNN